MTPVMRARLLAASEFVLDELGKKTPPAAIISGLVEHHRGAFRRGDPNTLRVAGIAVSCTTSEDVGLLGYWRKAAMAKLMGDDRP